MRSAEIFMHGQTVGILSEKTDQCSYTFEYNLGYAGEPISLTMPIQNREYVFANFPSFFEGLLPEGGQLEGLLRREKLDRSDFFAQLILLGNDLVGAVTVKELF